MKKKIGILAYIIFAIGGFTAVLCVSEWREVFTLLTTQHPFVMGFAKFALLATAGELIAARMASGSFRVPCKIVYRFVIWGLIGMWITLMMKAFNTFAASGMLPLPEAEGWRRLLIAFYTSVIMNTGFGPTFMALHKCSDCYLERWSQGLSKGITDVIDAVDWKRFATFTIGKTVPFFWIPAHTLTFLLPGQYQVVSAAFLSVALGILLNLKRKERVARA